MELFVSGLVGAAATALAAVYGLRAWRATKSPPPNGRVEEAWERLAQEKK